MKIGKSNFFHYLLVNNNINRFQKFKSVIFASPTFRYSNILRHVVVDILHRSKEMFIFTANRTLSIRITTSSLHARFRLRSSGVSLSIFNIPSAGNEGFLFLSFCTPYQWVLLFKCRFKKSSFHTLLHHFLPLENALETIAS